MEKIGTSSKMDRILARAGKWRGEFEKLRAIILEFPVVEQMKWGWPCYSFQDGNVVLIHGFKEYCALLFFKGVLLKDKKKILIQQTENVQVARQIRFTSASEITKLEKTVKAYIYEAVEVEEAGLKAPLKITKEFAMPEEFEKKLDKNRSLKKAFEALTPGRQRGYLLYFSSAKQTKTRELRIEKCLPQILEGKGLED